MRILNPDIDLDIFNRRLKEASQRILLLDYDGTLAPFNKDPKEAYPYPGIVETLNCILKRADTRMVLISGRAIKDLLPLINLDRQPEIWGAHGMERLLTDNTYETAQVGEKALKGLVTGEELVESLGFRERKEKKHGSLALHWRGLDEDRIHAIKELVCPQWSLIAKDYGLNLMDFDGGIELRVSVLNKGDAVSKILKDVKKGFVGAYLGDDITDEDAFKAIKGNGIGVLVRGELRPTYADLWIQPPEELMAFLHNWLH